jgi:hypothetical protein
MAVTFTLADCHRKQNTLMSPPPTILLRHRNLFTKTTVGMNGLTDRLLENGDTPAHVVPWFWNSIPRRSLTTFGKTIQWNLIDSNT